jgi:hypothetical protein
MKTKHIIVGENNRCLCGTINDQSVCCEDIIAAIDHLVDFSNSSPFVKGNTPEAHAISNIYYSINPLIKEI